MRAKWSGAKHNFAVLDVGGARQALCQSISNHKVSAKSDESKNTLKDQFTNEITTDIDMT
jgi:hypothetical protein